MASTALAERARSLPPTTYFVGSAVFHYLGPAFAVLLFALVEPLGVAWLRIASAALVLAAWRRPWRRLAALGAGARRLLVAMGAVLALMNACFYLAIDRLPLGTVAAIEFLPMVLLAALGARGWRNGLALLLAVAGVYLLTDVRLASEPAGLAFAFANAALFALYVVLAHRVSRTAVGGGIDGLAAAMVVAAVVATPLAGPDALPALVDPVALAAGVGVGVTSSVIPYVCDQLAMARLPRGTYALLVSLLPATATVVGLVVLAQVPAPVEAAGVALVVGGIAVHRERVQPTGVVPSPDGARARPAPSPPDSHGRDRPPRPRRGRAPGGSPHGALLRPLRRGHGGCPPRRRRRPAPRAALVASTRTRRLFVWALLVSLCLTGAIAIGTLLFAEFDERAGRILGTTALLALASLLGMPAGVLLDQGRAPALAWGLLAAVTAGFALGDYAVWSEGDPEWTWKAGVTLGVFAAAGAQAAVSTSQLRPDDGRRLRLLYSVAIALGVVVAALVAVAVWAEVEDAAGFYRILSATVVAAVLVSLAQPLVRRAARPAERRPQLVLELDREPSDEAVAAAVEALARHGVRAEVVARPGG